MSPNFSVVALASVLAVSSCGGDDAPAKSEPEQKCESFAKTWCQQSMGCLVAVGTFTEAQRAEGETVCTDTAIAAAQCKRAVSVGSGYQQCISDIRAMDCSIWNVPEDQLSKIQLPPTCRGIVIISQ